MGTRSLEFGKLLQDCQIGDVVIFVLFGKETVGVVTKKVVVIDAGAGELEIDNNNIIKVVDEVG